MIFEIKILGCGSALPVVHRNPSSQLISISNKKYLIDCGEGTQIALRNNHIKIQSIESIFISHLHGDHYLGLMGLISTFNLLGRTKKLEIIGPKKLKDIINLQLEASRSRLQFDIVYLETSTNGLQKVYEDNLVNIYSFPLRHRIPCTGFKIVEKQKQANIIKSKIDFYNIPFQKINEIKDGADFIDEEGKVIPNENLILPVLKPRSYAYCSDTIYNENIIPFISGVDLLYHESTFLEKLRDRATKTFHSTAKDAAKIAFASKVDRLILGHYSARYKVLDEFLEEAKTIFENVELARDNKKFTIDQVRLGDGD